MALDRQSIEKKDFPIGRRGYDPEAVDAHLSVVADELEELESSTPGRSESLASAAGDQVRVIVEAAESTAAQMRGDADQEAKKIRREARAEAKKTRDQATAEATEHVSRVSAATASLLERIDTMEQELGGLVESLRTGASRLVADLKLLEGTLGEVTDAVSPPLAFEPEPDAAPEQGELAAESEYAQEDEDEDGLEDDDEPLAELAPPATEAEDDLEGARLIALNMALSGTTREDVDVYLTENFVLSDRAALLDEVFESVEG